MNEEWRDPVLFSKNLMEEKKKENKIMFLGPPPKTKLPTLYRPAHPDGQNFSANLLLFLLALVPDEKIMFLAGGLGLVFLFFLLFRNFAKKQNKRKAMKMAEKNNKIRPESLRHPDNWGV